MLKVGFRFLNRSDSFALILPIILMPPNFFILLFKQILSTFIDTRKQ